MGFIASTSLVTDTAITVPNLTGGTNGKVVRISGTNTVTDCTYNDTAVQLNTVLFKKLLCDICTVSPPNTIGIADDDNSGIPLTDVNCDIFLLPDAII
jgi:hypothetical protein